MPPNRPSIRPTQSNSPQETNEAIDSSRKMAEAMKQIYSKMTDPVEYKGQLMAGKKMDIKTPKGTITLYMQGKDSVWVSNGKEALLFSREGNFFSLTHIPDHSQPYVSGGTELYRYNPSKKPAEAIGSAKEYTASVNTFIELIKGI